MRRCHSRNAFTLIEVMMAVVIVSVVIAALLQMRGDTNHKFIQIKKILKSNQYNSFLLSVEDKYGYESSSIDIYKLTDNFDLESDLRRKLKAIKIKIDYEEIQVIDSSDFGETSEDSENTEDSENEELASGANLVFEIGKTSLKNDDFSLSLMRVRVQ